MRWPDADYMAVLRSRFGDFPGEIALKGKRFTHPLNLTVANAFVADRLALIGDAAHGMHLITARAECRAARCRRAGRRAGPPGGRGEDFASALVLARHQEWRRFTQTLAMATDLTNKLFERQPVAARRARYRHGRAVNAMPGLRRGFMREAAGSTGELPELTKRKPGWSAFSSRAVGRFSPPVDPAVAPRRPASPGCRRGSGRPGQPPC
ncbi:MAG: hypothetical protein R3D85_05480 [Paracoccaceae bacterium]